MIKPAFTMQAFSMAGPYQLRPHSVGHRLNDWRKGERMPALIRFYQDWPFGRLTDSHYEDWLLRGQW